MNIGFIMVGALLGAMLSPSLSGATFVNFETAPVHPLDMSPDGKVLAVANLPDGRVDVFSLETGLPLRVDSVAVGVDPVSVRFRGTNELWVANYISRTVSIVELAPRQVVATLPLPEGPADIVFANGQAFVSCPGANCVVVIDPVTRGILRRLVIRGDRPKSMSVSPDGSRVYVAVFESGNASTILGPRLVDIEAGPVPGPLEHESNPYGGQNPPPNDGLAFDPPLHPSLASLPLPPVAHIVKKNAAGRWMDDNNADWTEFVSGTNAPVSGRPMGWDMPDHDLAVIHTGDFSIQYVRGLMNICMSTAVNPASGMISVIGTDATNERRFEPNLRGTFVRVHHALVDPATLQPTITDLNPHLDYGRHTVAPALRNRSLGDPRAIVWSSDGARGYVAGMGSRNVVAVDAAGDRSGAAPIDVPEGPAGLVLDEAREQLYVYSRFEASLAVISTASDLVTHIEPMHDATPEVIRLGRRHLYDTRKNSGLGQASCASCHVDARIDRLAWDLGDPSLDLLSGGPFGEDVFHPMKGPMVTQTFQDMVRFGTLHWRGDRTQLADFNQTFPALLGADSMLPDSEMQEFHEFLDTIHFPPNPLRHLDNSLPVDLPLPGHRGLGNNHTADGPPLPSGNALRGREIFLQRCDSCHNGDTGLNPDTPIRFLQRGGGLPFKVSQLRSLRDKVGMDLAGTNSQAGFGFLHDGTVDSLSRFLLDGFGEAFLDDADVNQSLADTIAFLLSFAGSGLQSGRDGDHASRDAHAALGWQMTATNTGPHPELDQVMALTHLPSPPVGLVVHGVLNGEKRGWFYDPNSRVFLADRHGEWHTNVLEFAGSETPMTFTAVGSGSETRLGVDRDGDGYYDGTERDFGTDPANASSVGINQHPVVEEPAIMYVHAGQVLDFQVETYDPDLPAQSLTVSTVGAVPDGLTMNHNGRVTWSTPHTFPRSNLTFLVMVQDDGTPALSTHVLVSVSVVGPFEMLPLTLLLNGWTSIRWNTLPDQRYQVQYTSKADDTNWQPLSGILRAWSEHSMSHLDRTEPRPPARFYRVVMIQ